MCERQLTLKADAQPATGPGGQIPGLSASGRSRFSEAGGERASGDWHIPAAQVVAQWESGLIVGIGPSP